MWWCFDMPEHGMGGAIYYSYMPNGPKPLARLLVYIAQGWNREPDRFIYQLNREFPIPDADWNDLDVGGLIHFRRIEPLRRWHILFDDQQRLRLDIDIDLFAGTWHYIDNVHETPKYLAGDRYHRPYAGRGSMRLDGREYALDLTGDSDHSWGPRRWEPLYRSKYIAGQCGRRWAFSIMEAYDANGGAYPYGFVWDGSKLSAVSGLEVACRYDGDGVQRSVLMNVIDADARLSRIEGECFCSAPTEYGEVRSNDTWFNFEVDGGRERGSGILSFFWNRAWYERVMRI